MSSGPGREREQVVCGWHAVRSALEHRPSGLRRLFLTQERARELHGELRQLAQRRIPYRIVGPEEIERVCGSRAHQGLCGVFEAPGERLASRRDLEAFGAGPGVWLALDGVGNPQNLGAIVRTAGFLGARGLLLARPDASPLRSGAALRTAEGAMELLPVWQVPDLAEGLSAFRCGGGQVVALCLQDSAPLGQWQPKFERGIALVAGAEQGGVRPEVRKACDLALRIDGSGSVQSLNVGVAAGIALAKALGRS